MILELHQLYAIRDSICLLLLRIKRCVYCGCNDGCGHVRGTELRHEASPSDLLLWGSWGQRCRVFLLQLI